jgi:hypothetical protein
MKNVELLTVFIQVLRQTFILATSSFTGALLPFEELRAQPEFFPKSADFWFKQ